MTSKPPRGDLLVNTAKHMEQLGHALKGTRRDAYGAYAAGFTSSDEHLPFLLVVKTSTLQREGADVVSFHKSIIDTWHGAVVMGLGDGPLPEEYIVFHPDIIRRQPTGENKWVNQRSDRPSVDMVNFSVFLGHPWRPTTEKLEDVWKSLSLRNSVQAKEKIDGYY